MKIADEISIFANSFNSLRKKYIHKLIYPIFQKHVSKYLSIYISFLKFLFGFGLLFLPFFYFSQEIRNFQFKQVEITNDLMKISSYILLMVTVYNFLFIFFTHKYYEYVWNKLEKTNRNFSLSSLFSLWFPWAYWPFTI